MNLFFTNFVLSLERYNQSEALNEEQIKNRLYQAVEITYQYVMFSSGVKWLGYSASVGFQVEGIDWFEPPLQRLLSQLHLKKNNVSANEYVQLFKNSITALRNFDYQKEILPQYHQEFLDLKCPEIIEYVAGELEKSISEVKS